MPGYTLEGQHVVIIGGSSGIGLAVAECAIADGAEVVVGSSNAANVEAAASRLGNAATGAVVDVRDEASVEAFLTGVAGFDHLVFTAGDWDPSMFAGSVAQLDFGTVDAGLKVRFWGALMAVKHALPHLSERGSITLTDGVLVHRPRKGMPLTAAFGGAIEHLVRGLAVDIAPVRVNAVCPGFVLTERARQMPPQTIQQMTGHQPLPRPADPAEVAQAYLYAMRGGYTTGQVLIVDGGLLLV